MTKAIPAASDRWIGRPEPPASSPQPGPEWSPRLSEKHLGLLGAFAEEVRLPRGRTFLRELGGRVVVVKTGLLKLLLVSTDSGRTHVLHLLGPGDIYGDLLDQKPPRPLVVEAAEDARLLVVPRTRFEQWLESRPDLALTVVKTIWRSLLILKERVEGLAFQGVPVRLVRQLLALARDRGTPTPDGVRIDLKLTQSEFGALIGASREMVNHTLGAFRRQGLIALEGRRRLVVRRPEALQALADGRREEPA